MHTQSGTRREMAVHDALAFLTLTLVTAVLFVVTLFLFRSFTGQRKEQAKLWTAKGQTALSSGRAEEAAADFRKALTLAPGTHADDLLLAHSLSAAGPKHTEEAYNYFLQLWDDEPGNGQINLELARLAARREDLTAAVQFYRLAVDGRWDRDGRVNRRQVRLELARYLIAQHDARTARMELFAVEANWAGDSAVQSEVNELLSKIGTTQ